MNWTSGSALPALNDRQLPYHRREVRGGRLVASRSVKRALHVGLYRLRGRSHGKVVLRGQSKAILLRRSYSWKFVPNFPVSRHALQP